jgi:uncharacterized protein YdhG (YjbR/CyaY superfamily)
MPNQKTGFKSVDDYIAAQPKNVQAALRRVRSIVRKAVPSAVEVISYQIPAFKVAGGFFLYLGAWKEHYSLYPASDALVAAFKGALTPYRASKGTLRFPLSEPVPAKLIERIAKFQAKDAARRAKAKLALRKKVR